VQSGLDYLAYAFAEGSNKPVFYNQKDGPNNADRLFIDENLADINFILDGKHSDNSERVKVPGSVQNESNEALSQVMVIAITMDAAGTVRNEHGAMSMTNAEGKFELNLEEGIYRFLAIPTSEDYMPGFFVSEDVATQIITQLQQDLIIEDGDYPTLRFVKIEQSDSNMFKPNQLSIGNTE